MPTNEDIFTIDIEKFKNNYQRLARNIIYPDLRKAYKNDRKIIQKLSSTLKWIDENKDKE